MVARASRACGSRSLHLGEHGVLRSETGLDIVGEGRAHGTVTKREGDRLYAFVDIDSRLEIELAPPPEQDAVKELVKAERGCFVSNSLERQPRHHWTVNDEEIE